MKKRDKNLVVQPGLSFWQKMIRDWQLWAFLEVFASNIWAHF